MADYTQPGAMRAGIELFTVFEKAEKGKLAMPVLGLGGTASFFLPMAERMLSEVAENVTVRPVEESGHWMAEEQPGRLLERLRTWFEETGG
ncbi:alpha/beta fold hydrolase [Streptomyces sp. NPDC004324]